MADIDFARIISDTLFDPGPVGVDPDREDEDGEFVGYLLDAPVPALCPDCHGVGYRRANDIVRDDNDVRCSHPNAPTIGRLLRIGEAVLRDDTAWPEARSTGDRFDFDAGVNNVVRYLRTVE